MGGAGAIAAAAAAQHTVSYETVGQCVPKPAKPVGGRPWLQPNQDTSVSAVLNGYKSFSGVASGSRG